MKKNQKSIFIAIGLLCFISIVRSAWIDWPKQVVNPTDPAGFLSKFQISTDKPENNKVFQTQCIFYLKKQIDWQGLSDRNIYVIINSTGKETPVKNLRQFATDGGHYKPGDNITIGFNFTYETSLNATKGAYLVYLGYDDMDKGKIFDILYNFPTNNQNDDNLSANTDSSIEIKVRYRENQQIIFQRQYYYKENELKNLKSDQNSLSSKFQQQIQQIE